ncbi:MAG: hypothetical protein NTZ18_01045 [Candidatus Komeilibacteria bacterium]|nr:hypothetical protein [Candidatus Komeilibacteria bacterium]
MFTPPNNNPADNSGNDQQPNQAADLPFNEESVPEEDIHTMPDKFLQPSSSAAPGRGRVNWLILGIVIFLALGGVIVTVILFLGRSQAPAAVVLPPANQTQLNANAATTTNDNLNLNGNLNQNANINLDSAAARDARRLSDLAGLASALNLYFATYQIFPSSLNNLVSEFLNELPLNPATGTAPAVYNYQPGEGQQSYQIAFSLENGGNWGIVKLPAGNYYLTPIGVAPQSLGGNNNNNTNANISSTATPPIISSVPGKGLDSDNDGLSDIEENLYRTNPALADTDNDGYADAAEILGLYDPLKPNARLMASGLIKVYQNPNYHYSLFYPAAWSYRALGADNSEVIFTATTGEFIKVGVVANPLSLSAVNWYLAQNKTADPATLKKVTVADFPAIQSPDGLIAYLAAGSNIYTIAYDIGSQQQMNFYTTYQLFLKSFIFVNP